MPGITYTWAAPRRSSAHHVNQSTSRMLPRANEEGRGAGQPGERNGGGGASPMGAAILGKDAAMMGRGFWYSTRVAELGWAPPCWGRALPSWGGAYGSGGGT